MSSTLEGPETVSVKFKTKYLWLMIGLLLCLLAVSPVVASFLPATTAAPVTSGSAGAAPNCSNPCTIIIQNSLFGPSQPTIVTSGTAITWINKDDTQHTVTSNAGLFDSGVLAVGKSFSYTFSSPGVYDYHCNIHPMTGEVQVVS